MRRNEAVLVHNLRSAGHDAEVWAYGRRESRVVAAMATDGGETLVIEASASDAPHSIVRDGLAWQ